MIDDKAQKWSMTVFLIIISVIFLTIAILFVGVLAQKFFQVTSVPAMQLGLGVLGLFGVCGTFITGFIALRRYRDEKNRDIYIRRLNEVYAPLYGLLIKQELFRKIKMPHVSREEAPIITLTTVKRSGSIGRNEKGALEIKYTEDEEITLEIMNRDNYIKVLNHTNKGLARPNLLVLLYKYEMLIYLEESLNVADDKWLEATNEKVRIENLLIQEISSGYKETLSKLGFSDTEITNAEFLDIGL